MKQTSKHPIAEDKKTQNLSRKEEEKVCDKGDNKKILEKSEKYGTV